jgi:MbtH protein
MIKELHKQADANETVHYMVVINHENEYAVWPQERALPEGWRATSHYGTRAECLAYLQLLAQGVLSAKSRRRKTEAA